MKIFFLACMTLATVNSFAASNCENKAIRSAIKSEFPKGIQDGFAVDAKAKLVKANGETLTYKIELLTSYTDGTSTDEFPADIYTVMAKGSNESCKILIVKKSK